MEEVNNSVVPVRYLTTTEVAKILNFTKATLHKLTHNGTIRGYKVGNRVRYLQEDIDNSLKRIGGSNE